MAIIRTLQNFRIQISPVLLKMKERDKARAKKVIALYKLNKKAATQNNG